MQEEIGGRRRKGGRMGHPQFLRRGCALACDVINTSAC